jgi:hypothetical protein
LGVSLIECEMRTTLVTIDTPRESLDLELPAETPLRELAPALLRLVGLPAADGSDSWILGREQSGPLPPARSLLECDVVDGTRLVFQRASQWRAPKRAKQADRVAANISAGPIGVRWRRDGLLSGT